MKIVKANLFSIIAVWILCPCCLLVFGACEKEGKQGQQTGSEVMESRLPQKQPKTGSGGSQATRPVAKNPVDPCSLLTRTEVEAELGRTVLPPQKEELANLATCSYGDPALPGVGGHPFPVVTISIFVGDAQYYAGAEAQARGAFEEARKNAASVQPVSGLGDDAYWDKTFGTLTVLKGKYWVDIKIEQDTARVDIARRLATKLLSRLP